MTNVVSLIGRSDEAVALEEMATYLETLAQDLREGKKKLSGLFAIEVDPSGYWIRKQFGVIYATTLLGYMQRSIYEISKELDDNNG